MGNKDIRLDVAYLGPVKTASVEIRPLTVFIGRSNTGKTYLAQTLYAARKAIEQPPPYPHEPLTTNEYRTVQRLLQRRARELERKPAKYPQLQLEDNESLQNTAASTTTASLTLESLPQSVQAKTEKWIGETLKNTEKAFERRLLASFSEHGLEKISSWSQSEPVEVQLRDVAEDFCYFGIGAPPGPDLSRIGDMEIEHLVWMSRIYASMPVFTEEGIEDSTDSREYASEYSQDLLLGIWAQYLADAGLLGSAHYLPAGRSGLLHAWTDVVKLRMELERDRYGLPGIPEASLDGVSLDFISSLAGILANRPRTHRRHRHLLHYYSDLLFHYPLGRRSDRDHQEAGDQEDRASLMMLRELMEGAVHAGSDDDNVPTLDYRQNGNRIPIRRASSMVADLAPLAMWIDRIVEPGDLLIIDEPESHLHPHAVRLVARALIRLVNEGVRVVCTTHSSVFLHELSNCMLIGRLSESSSQDLPSDYTHNDIIQFDEIAVHRFHRPETDGPVHVTQVEIDRDWGIPEDEYVDIAGEMADLTANLIRRLP